MGAHPVVFLDKLGARLAFERMGTRLWEALLSKFDSYGSFTGGPTRDELERIATEEFEHFRLLNEAMIGLGADPTVVTPSANLQANLSKAAGLFQAPLSKAARLAAALQDKREKEGADAG